MICRNCFKSKYEHYNSIWGLFCDITLISKYEPLQDLQDNALKETTEKPIIDERNY